MRHSKKPPAIPSPDPTIVSQGGKVTTIDELRPILNYKVSLY